jgi:hypothetical protein
MIKAGCRATAAGFSRVLPPSNRAGATAGSRPLTPGRPAGNLHALVQESAPAVEAPPKA